MKTSPLLTVKELQLFESVLACSNSYFEYGVGGSTVHVYNSTSAIIRGIDSVEGWVERVSSEVNSPERCSLKYIDIGPTEVYGRPTGAKRIWPDVEDVSIDLGQFPHFEKWPRYPTSIFDIDIVPDTIFIDGRFRVACALQSILFSNENEISPVIMFHDCNRKHYRKGFVFLDEVARADNLAVFKINHGVDIEAVKESYELHKFNFE